MPKDIIDVESTPVQPAVTDLKIISNVYEFKWNFAEIKQGLESHIEKYVGLVVTEENLNDMEAAQKEIASIRTKVDGFRKEVKKKMEEPYKVFEGEIKELLQLIEKAENPLKDQTLKYERERIAAKEAELDKFAQTTALNMGVRNRYYNFVCKSQWTNRTAKDSAVRKEIVTAIEAMLAAQRRDDELKELEKQRTDLIEGQCLVHSVGLKTPVVPGDVNHLLVGVSLSEIPVIILAECQKRADMEAKAAEPKVELPPPVVAVEPPQPDHVHHPDDNSIGFPNYGTECDLSCEPSPVSIQQEYGNQNLHVPASFIAPPLPPAPRLMPPMPPAVSYTQLYDVVLKLPGVTVEQATALKAFMATHGITYQIVSQEEVRGAF